MKTTTLGKELFILRVKLVMHVIKMFIFYPIFTIRTKLFRFQIRKGVEKELDRIVDHVLKNYEIPTPRFSEETDDEYRTRIASYLKNGLAVTPRSPKKE